MPEASERPAGRPALREPSQAVRTALTGQSALQQATRLMEHLKKQLEELDRREANLNRQLIAFDNERRSLKLLAQQIETQSTHREQELAGREEELLNRESACDARAEELEAATQQLTEERTALEQERAGLRDDVDRELEQKRQDLLSFQSALDDREAALTARDAVLEQSNADLEKRTRLHEDHLARLRSELSVERADHERDTARRRVWATELEQTCRLRLAQIQRLRGLLDRREASLESESQLLHERQVAADAEIERQRLELLREQEKLAAAIDEHAKDVERQQEMLNLQAENLEGRRERLDHLRDDLDEERQETLESRLVVEQVFSQTVHALDVPAAQERVQNARTKLFDHYRELRESLTRRRQECEESQRHLVERRDSYQAERDEQIQRVAEREEELSSRILELDHRAADFSARQAQFAIARDRWRHERLEAERVIRNLLGELERAANESIESLDASGIASAGSRIVPLPPDEMSSASAGYAYDDDEPTALAA